MIYCFFLLFLFLLFENKKYSNIQRKKKTTMMNIEICLSKNQILNYYLQNQQNNYAGIGVNSNSDNVTPTINTENRMINSKKEEAKKNDDNKDCKFICPIDFSDVENRGYFAVDLVTGKLNQWDPNLGKIYGIDLTKKENQDKFLQDWAKIINPPDLDKVVKANAAAYSNGKYNTQYIITTPTGEKKKIMACGQITYDSDGVARILQGFNQVIPMTS
jgi:hypothetical protein